MYPARNPSAAHADMAVAVWPPQNQCRLLMRTLPESTSDWMSPGIRRTWSIELAPTPMTSVIARS